MFSIFFLPWAILMLVAIVAVPIAMKLDGSGAARVDDGAEAVMEEGAEAEYTDGEVMADPVGEYAADAASFDAVEPQAVESLSDDDFAEFG